MTKNYLQTCYIFFICLLSACGGSDSDKKVEEPTNNAPTALISLNVTSIILNDSVAISGDKSLDPDGDVLSYEWSMKTAAGDSYPLTNSTAESFVFTPENFGTYTVTLKVKDAQLSSEVVTTTIIVEPNAQSYPVAIISDDISSKIGKVNWFSAENSTAAEGQLLTYLWTVNSKPATSISEVGDATKVKGFLIADAAGVYEVSLTVTNTENKLTATAILTIVAEELLVNSAPVAVISNPLPSYSLNQTVKLNATASYDSDNDPLTYQWSVSSPVAAHDLVLTGDTTEFVEFPATVIGDYQITLEVSDNKLLANIATQTITVTRENIAPVANAGSDQVVILGFALVLDGAGSTDAEGENLEYKWSLVSKPALSNYSGLSNAHFTPSSSFGFVADTVGEYVLALEVFDGIKYSAIDQVHIEVTENQRPIAILPDDIVVRFNGSQVVGSTGSFDPEGRALIYSWKLLNVPENSTATILTEISLPTTNFIADLPGTYTVQLIVNDGIQDSSPATVNIVYTPEDLFELTVSGRLIDEAGLPLSITEIGGILQLKSASDDNGNFEILLQSRKRDAALTVLTLADEDILSAILVIPESEQQQMDIGNVKLPVLQRKDISLTACQDYTGTDNVTVHFYLSTDGYENMRFIKPVVAELTVGEEPQVVRLPAKGIINMRLPTSTSGQLYVAGGDAFFTHQYQTDDSQQDVIAITVCN